MTSLSGRVEYILQNYPNTRNSDLELQAALANYFYPPLEYSINNWRDIVIAMSNIPGLDHIARVRRKVIEVHQYQKYLPTHPDVAKARKIDEKVWKAYARKNNYTTREYKINVPKEFEADDLRDNL